MKPSDTQKTMINTIAGNCLSVRLRLMNRLVGAIFDDALRPHGIRASQLGILVAVSAFGRATSRQLCQLLHMESSTFSRALKRMKHKGWLEVEPSGEGRILNIGVSEKGYQVIEQVYDDWQLAQEKAAAALGETASEAVIASGNKRLLDGMTE